MKKKFREFGCRFCNENVSVNDLLYQINIPNSHWTVICPECWNINTNKKLDIYFSDDRIFEGCFICRNKSIYTSIIKIEKLDTTKICFCKHCYDKNIGIYDE